MKPRDEMTALAAEYLRNRDAIAERVGDAFANIPRAPLAKIVDDLVEMQPQFSLNPLLKRIGELNQGRVDDLNMPQFQSYLIAKCETNEMDLRRAISAINSFLLIRATASGGDKAMLIAARDGENSGQKSATMSDILKQISKRK